MVFGAWRRWRDDAAAARRAIPDDLWKRTLVRYPFLRLHDPALAADLRRQTSLFLDRKEFSAAGGLRLNDAMVVAIAAQAVLPVLRLGLSHYDGFVGIVVHPDQVLARREHTDEHGIVHEYEEPLAGEALEGGPVMLSWRDVRAAGTGPSSGPAAYNVVIHEFVHVLDMADGSVNGVPPLPADISPSDWLATLTSGLRRFETLLAATSGTDLAPSVLDPYGAESLDEFFPVASEAFFTQPQALKSEQPELYGLFVRYFCQDPASQVSRSVR
ncbi:MAG: zinc-dependent peptidase [Rubrivivax sp.]|jgi:Mlc titration factor MtfA (ptsG expression regulator)|nr:zinc-dependent peptidase [Rubrivivax sp.]